VIELEYLLTSEQHQRARPIGDLAFAGHAQVSWPKTLIRPRISPSSQDDPVGRASKESISDGFRLSQNRSTSSPRRCACEKDLSVKRDRLDLSERVYQCEGCGLVMDRDLNAARNLAQLVSTVSSTERVPN
jgi:hypothetical protein